MKHTWDQVCQSLFMLSLLDLVCHKACYDKRGEASQAMLKSWRSLLRCELATCVCFVRAYTCVYVCVCVCVCVCARVRVHACVQLAHICQSNLETRILRTRSHRHRVILHKFLSPLQLELWKFVHPVVCLHGAANFSSRLSLDTDPAGTRRNVSCQRLCGQMMFGEHGLG